MDRTERFGMILSPAEKQVLQRLAEGEGGLSQAALLRHLLRQAARERGLLPSSGTHNEPETADELDVTENRQAILDALEVLGRSKVGDIAQAVGRNRGNVYKDLQDLAAAGRVIRLGDTYGLPYLGVVER